MPALIALAASVGLLAVLDTWLFFGPLSGTLVAGLVWVSFIAWGCHFHSGGGTKGTTTTVVCMSWGALVGMLAVMLANGPLGPLDDPIALGIAVGLGAAVICLSSAVSLLATIPARERRILILRFFGNMTQSQIAADIGISQMHVSRLLSQTLAKLREGLLKD